MTTDPVETGNTAENRPAKPQPKFRLRTLLIIPLALLVLVGFYGPRQYKQKRAVDALKTLGATVRTSAVSVPLLPELAGPEYAVEITEIYWRNPKVTNDDLQAIAGLTTVTKLELVGANVDDAGLEHLRGLTGLDTLHLADTKVKGPGLAAISGLKLRVLSLDNTSVGDDGVALVAAIPTLEQLIVPGTAVTDAGLASLAPLTSLKWLNLNNTGITDAGIVHITPLTTLETLQLNGTKVTEQGIQELVKALPKCQILRPGANE